MLQEEQTAGDWHRDRADAVTESEAPDTEFIQRLASSFEERFGMPLPHPKVDSVVDRVAPLAFGTNAEEGGHKFLIFTRRVSTVHTLCDRLTLRHRPSHRRSRAAVLGRRPLDWSGKSVQVEESDDTEDPEGFDTDPGESPFRKAMSKKGMALSLPSNLPRQWQERALLRGRLAAAAVSRRGSRSSDCRRQTPR